MSRLPVSFFLMFRRAFSACLAAALVDEHLIGNAVGLGLVFNKVDLQLFA